MGQDIIEEPQLSYLLELLTQLGSAGNDFVLTGGQAIRFVVRKARPTRDFDFVLNVISLRKIHQSITNILEKLQYKVDPKARCFQFIKEIPNSVEKMQIEFLASEKEKRPKDFRVDVQQNIHARACTGAEIVLRESDWIPIKGALPDGKPVETQVRVARSHALLMLKLFAMDDRYQRNLRGHKEDNHDREEARIHAADIVSIIRDNIQKPDFPRFFWSQFGEEDELKHRALDIIPKYFRDLTSSGIQLYAEFLRMQRMDTGGDVELQQALREIKLLHYYSVSQKEK